eukprot:119683-Hanusia_phi.AAC.2
MPDPHPLIPLVPQSSSLTLPGLARVTLPAPPGARYCPGGGTAAARAAAAGSKVQGSLVTELLLDWEPRRVTARPPRCHT